MFHREDFEINPTIMELTPNTPVGGEKMERYLLSPSGAPSSVYLAPPSPFSMESRRDSIASSQSSMSSFASSMSDYARPVSPVASHSLLAEEGCVDVMTYGMGHGFDKGPNIHGFPFNQPAKPFEPEHGCYGSWETVPNISPFAGGHSLPFSADLVIRTPGSFTMPTVPENDELEADMMQGAESWIEIPSAEAPNMMQSWESSEMGPEAAHGGLHAPWSGEMQPQQVTMESYVPSVAMVDVSNAYVPVEHDSFSGSDSFVEVNPSFVLSPQEVFFKKESSPSPDDSDYEDASWPTRTIHVSPTGGKTVKKEQRSRNAKFRSRVSKRSKDSSDRKRGASDTLLGQGDQCASVVKGDPDYADDKSTVFHGGVEVIRKDLMLIHDETTGTVRWGSSKAPTEKHFCNYITDQGNGNRCNKEFKRKEHLKRHERTHLGDREFPCRVCRTTFNRHDNLQAHVLTHLRLPGKKDGRNSKKSLAELEAFCLDSASGRKLLEKLRQKWKNEGLGLTETNIKSRL